MISLTEKVEKKQESFTEMLLNRVDEQLKRAYQKVQEHEAEKEREIASFIKQNERFTEQIKDLFSKSSFLGTAGYFSKIELFSHCLNILFQQTEDYTHKKKLQENPFNDMLIIGREIEGQLLDAKSEFEKTHYDVWESTTKVRMARENFIDLYNTNLPKINFFIQETLKGTIILTEKWKGRETILGKPSGF